VVETCQRRNLVSLTVALWVVSGLFSAIVLNFTVNARGFLPLVPAAAILLVRRYSAMHEHLRGRACLWLPMIGSGAVALSLAVTDYSMANSARLAAEQIAADYKTTDHQLWFEGHWGFQYYLEKLGGRPLDVERSILQPGDIVVVPWVNDSFTTFPAGTVGWVGHLEYEQRSWINLMGENQYGSAGFSGAGFGPLPFVPGKVAARDYYVLKVFEQVQFNVEPANLRRAQANYAPLHPHAFFAINHRTLLQENPEAIRQTRLAHQMEANGNTLEALEHYREALNADPDSPLALNNSAWILATANRTELRNGKEALRLAAKAYQLTDGTQPVIITTLAVAAAETGQFENAVGLAQMARDLARLTDQPKVVAINEKLLSRFIAGKTAEGTPAPFESP